MAQVTPIKTDLRNSRNALLRRMPHADRERLQPHFKEEEVEFKKTLLEDDKPIRFIYFIESGVASMVTDLTDGETVETGTVGNEGLVGLGAVLGVRRATGRVLMQIPGRAMRVAADVIAAEGERATPWFRVLLRYASFVNAMVAQTAACNRMHSVDARMSRWLLMTHDRVDSDDFPLTQEFLGQMLGVARPTVNVAGATLQKAGFIKYTRGRITVIDRAGLETATCECYRRIRDELERTLDSDRVDIARPARNRRRQ
jgi:CRP-like cAMP-binding protein